MSQWLSSSFLYVVCLGALGGARALIGIMIGLADRAHVPEPIIWRNRCSVVKTQRPDLESELQKHSCMVMIRDDDMACSQGGGGGGSHHTESYKKESQVFMTCL